MNFPFSLKRLVYKSLFISGFYIDSIFACLMEATHDFQTPSNRSILHLNGVYLKDFVRSAKIVLAFYFARGALLRSKTSHTPCVDKPHQYKGFNNVVTISPLKSIFSQRRRTIEQTSETKPRSPSSKVTSDLFNYVGWVSHDLKNLVL